MEIPDQHPFHGTAQVVIPLMAPLSHEEAIALVARTRSAGGRVVFTNGVFDLVHPGHGRYLQAAAAEGDLLIVGLNADGSVRANKGAGRPFVPAAERAEVIEALACVDAVVIFAEPMPGEVIARLQPDVLVKGADWPADQVVGRETVEARGGRVVRVALEQGYSTTAIVEHIRSLGFGRCF